MPCYVEDELWGLQLAPHKTYTQEIEMPFKVTMAALGPNLESEKRSSVMLKVDDTEYVLCSLTPGKIEQQILNHTFILGEKITIYVTGDNTVHLTGNFLSFDEELDEGYPIDLGSEDSDGLEYLDEDEDELDDEDEDEELEDEDEPKLKELTSDEEKKLISQVNKIKNVKSKQAQETDSEDSFEYDEEDMEDSDEDEDFDDEEEIDEDDMSESEIDEEDFDDEEEIDEDDMSESEIDEDDISEESEEDVRHSKYSEKKRPIPEPVSKNNKKSKADIESKPKQQVKKVQIVETPKKDENAVKNVTVPSGQKQPFKKVLPSGLSIEDVKPGDEKAMKVKPGRKVSIVYKATLPDGKVVESVSSSKPIEFSPYDGTIIKGLDQGINGMALNSTRKIIVPPSLIQGGKGVPNNIPKDTPIHYEVTVVKIANA